MAYELVKTSPIHVFRELILDERIDLTEVDSAGRTVLHAVTTRSGPLAEDALDVLTILLSKGGFTDEAFSVADRNGDTPFQLACQFASPELIRYLIRRGCDPRARGANRQAPIHHITRRGLSCCLDLLLRHDADGAMVSARDDFGNCALHIAAEFGSIELIGQLLDSGADIGEAGAAQRTPLHCAVVRSQSLADSSSSVVEFFLSRGSGISGLLDARDEDGFTPLMLACFRGTLASVEVLLEAGANCTGYTERRCSLLHLAACRAGECAVSAVSVLELLLDSSNGTDPRLETKDWQELTPLHLAVAFGPFDVIELLLKRGANPNSRSRGLRTPLHALATYPRDDHEKVAKLLLEHGACPTLTDVSGRNALQLSRAKFPSESDFHRVLESALARANP